MATLIRKASSANIKLNRQTFLVALRSGKYQKGTIKSDKQGRPIVRSEAGNGWCACALMHDLFYGYGGRRAYLTALSLTPVQCRKIQQQWNDKLNLSFPEIADRIEQEMFT